MARKTDRFSTEEMWTKLFASPNVTGYLSRSSRSAELPAFSEYIGKLREEMGVKPEKVLKLAQIEPSYGYKLFSGARNPSRETVLQLAFGFSMDLEKAQQLLKVARFAPLHPKIKRDAVIAYCLYHKQSIEETQAALQKAGLPLLGGERRHGI